MLSLEMIPDISSFTSAISFILSAVIVFEAYRAYRFTRRDYLLAFVYGFALLAISYALLIPMQFGIRVPTIGYTNGNIGFYPPRLVIKSAGFLLIALAYSRTPKAKYLMYGILASLIFLVLLVILPILGEVPYTVNALVFVVDLFLIVFILYRLLEKNRPTDLVMIAFAMMGVAEYTGIIAVLQGGPLTYFLVQIARVTSLALFFAAFLRVPQRRPIEAKPVRGS